MWDACVQHFVEGSLPKHDCLLLCLSALHAGIGTLLGAWLSERPGACPVLLGRTGRLSSPMPQLLLGTAPLTALRCDAAVAEEAGGALQAHHGSKLAAVLHAGGVLQDGVLTQQTAASVRAVFAPKLGFMVHCASAARLLGVQALSLFSSVSAFLGSPGQGNYAAANSALNCWADDLQQQGMAGESRIACRFKDAAVSNLILNKISSYPFLCFCLAGISTQWGAWASVGMAHSTSAVLARVERAGVGVLSPLRGLAAMQAVLTNGAPQPSQASEMAIDAVCACVRVRGLR